MNARYKYYIHGVYWRIYDYQKMQPLDEQYFSREEARKRVYELNGWTYTPKKDVAKN